MVSNTKHDTLKVSMFTVALPSAQSRTIGAVPARWFGLSCAESLGCVRRYGFLWLLALVHRCDICLRPPTISTRTPQGFRIVIVCCPRTPSLRACPCPNGESSAVECLLRPKKGLALARGTRCNFGWGICCASVKKAPPALAITRVRARPTQSPRALARSIQPPPLPACSRVEACLRACRLDLCFTWQLEICRCH